MSTTATQTQLVQLVERKKAEKRREMHKLINQITCHTKRNKHYIYLVFCRVCKMGLNKDISW